MVVVLRGSWGATGGTVKNFMHEIPPKKIKRKNIHLKTIKSSRIKTGEGLEYFIFGGNFVDSYFRP